MRQPIRSVRHGDQADPTGLRLAISVVTAVGIVGVVWLVGHIGYRLGFAPMVRVPEMVGEPGAGLATGVHMMIAVPRMIFAAGLAEPGLLMIAFVLIALPAAGLAAARPATPGGPRQRPAVSAIASAGAVAAMLSGIGFIAWTGSSARMSLLRVLPLHPSEAGAWYADLRTVAGLDALAVVAAALWVVLVMRLPIAAWLRALAGSAAFFALVVVTVAMAMSNATATQVGAGRSLCELEGVPGPRCLLLGSTRDHTVLLTAYDDDALVHLRRHDGPITVTGELSIVSYLERGR